MAKKYASDLPLPGGVEQYFDTLILLLRHVRDDPCDHGALTNWIIETFPKATQATAINGYIGLVSRMGLWSTKDDRIRLTPKGSDILEKQEVDPATARRAVADLKLSEVDGYDVLLKLLASGSRTFDQLDAHLKQTLQVDWKSKNQTMFRVNWLRSLGYVEKNGREYALTAEGRQLADSLGPITPPSPQPPIEPQPPPVDQTDLVRTATEIADRIEKAATEGGDGSALEQATADAFAFLGFSTQVISGSGNPDVIASTAMGDASYRVLIETKSRASGVIHQNDVNFNALNEHKAKANADYMIVLGADFSGGNLEKWAQEAKARLLRAEELRQLLLAHAEAVLPLDSLRDLMEGGGSMDEAALSDILAESENTAQSMRLAREVYEAILKHQDQEGTLNVHSLFYILGGASSIQSIEMTANLLKSDLIGAIGASDEGSLYTRVAPRTLRDKLTQLNQMMGSEPVKQNTE